MKKILKDILGYGVVAIVILAIISVIAIFGGGIMKMFGFEYDSVWSIIKYFIVVVIVGAPVELLTKAFPKALYQLGKIDEKAEKILFVIFDTLGSCTVLAIVDKFMDSVTASNLAIVIVSFVFAMTSIETEDKE